MDGKISGVINNFLGHLYILYMSVHKISGFRQVKVALDLRYNKGKFFSSVSLMVMMNSSSFMLAINIPLGKMQSKFKNISKRSKYCILRHRYCVTCISSTTY